MSGDRRGFTGRELLAVLAGLAILALMAIPINQMARKYAEKYWNRRQQAGAMLGLEKTFLEKYPRHGLVVEARDATLFRDTNDPKGTLYIVKYEKDQGDFWSWKVRIVVPDTSVAPEEIQVRYPLSEQGGVQNAEAPDPAAPEFSKTGADQKGDR